MATTRDYQNHERKDGRKTISLGIVVIVQLVMIAFLLSAGCASSTASTAASGTFEKAGDIAKPKIVVATAEKTDSGHIVVEYIGGYDAEKVSQVTVEVSDATGKSQTQTIGPAGTTGTPEPLTSITVTGDFSGKTHVIATAKFNDGTSQVILDTFV